MNNELNTEHYQALQRAFDTAWPGPIGQPIFWKKDIYVCKFFRVMVPESPRYRHLVLKCYVNGATA